MDRPPHSGTKPEIAAPDLEAIFHYSPVPTAILSPSYHILKACQSLLEVWDVSADACTGRELLEFLEERRLFLREQNGRYLVLALKDAVSRRAIVSTRTIGTEKGDAWSAKITPVFRSDELLSVVVVWESLPSEVAIQGLPQGGLSIDEAFGILVDAVKDYAIFLLDVDGNIATWNIGAELNKGYKKHEIIGKHFSIFYGDEDLRAGKPQLELEIAKRDGRVEDEGWRFRKDGTRFWANVILTAVYKDGVHVGFGKVTRDLTERKAAEWRLISAYEESTKLKSDFLANMSHEIRTPMHGMLSACSLLLDSPLSPEQRDTASIIGESGQVMLQVVNDILDYSKLAAGSFTINADVVCVSEIITSVVRSEQTTLAPAVHFELRLEPGLPKSVQGDPLRYRQVLQNIIGNATKFTDKGSICIEASVRDEGDDDFVILTQVIDTGIGISEAAAVSLFKPFTQLDDTARKRYQGTGLGLSISKSLAELMGGKIGYRPNPECQGSVFWFMAKFNKIKSMDQIQVLSKGLNLNDDDVMLSPSIRSEDDAVRRLKALAPTKRLLVVEDNPINQKILMKTLHSFGFSGVALASDGGQAVSMVVGRPDDFDLVLMDINMPVMDGHEATVRIRTAGVRVPIVAMTAHALKGQIELCLDKGMDDYVSKPMDRKRVVAILLKWLSGGVPTPGKEKKEHAFPNSI